MTCKTRQSRCRARVIRRVYSIASARRNSLAFTNLILENQKSWRHYLCRDRRRIIMKYLLCVTFALASFIFLPAASLAQTAKATEDSQTIKNEILALDQQVNDAAVAGDLRTLGQSMSDDYVGVAPNGMILRKAMIAAHYQAGALHYSSVVNSDVEIHIHDDCAVLTAIATVKGHDGDTDLSGTYRIMRVFLRRGGVWQIVAFQATPTLLSASS